MSRRKGKKPPTVNPKDMAMRAPPRVVEKPKTKHKGRVFYMEDQRRRLINRLMLIVGTEQRIGEIVEQMERARIVYDVKQLRRKLRRLGIWPPKVDDAANEYRACYCDNCKGRCSHPAYYNKNGLSVEAIAAKQEIDIETLNAAEREDAEEFRKLGGRSPGILIQIKQQTEGRSRRIKRERAA